MRAPISLAVVTGGHSFAVREFHALFRGLDEMTAYVQSMDDFCSSPRETRQSYDVVLFYHMLMDTPTDEGVPWYAGAPLTALSELGETSQGLVLLHHALLAYPEWPQWDQVVDISGRDFDYHVGQVVRTEVADQSHPITRGLGPWEMTDETYEMSECGAESHAILTCDHPKSMRTLAWTHTHREARVFCYQAGHDRTAYTNDHFRTALSRGILWAAGRL